MQIKAIRYHSILTRIAIIKKGAMTTVGKDIEKLELSYTPGGTEMATLPKFKNSHNITYMTLGYVPRRNKT